MYYTLLFYMCVAYTQRLKISAPESVPLHTFLKGHVWDFCILKSGS